MKNKIIIIILSIFLVLNIIATGILAYKVVELIRVPVQYGQAHYTLYVGTNDKDTYEQIIPTEEAKAIIDDICVKYMDGYAFQDATGTWTDENNIVTHENTIICYFDNIDDQTVYDIADEIRAALNQGTILIQKNTVQLDYYDGTREK